MFDAAITFYTTTDDKDHDSAVDAFISDTDGIRVAQILGVERANGAPPGDGFPNQTEATFWLPVGNPTIPIAKFQPQFELQLLLHANGHDTWVFNFIVRLWFTDGQKIEGSRMAVQMAQNNADLTFVLP